MLGYDDLDNDSPLSYPTNIYIHKDSLDSANSSGDSSRRNSLHPFSDFRDFVKRRRSNGIKHGSRHRPVSISSDETTSRKYSADSQFFEMDDSDDEYPTYRPRRRFSVPEKTFLNADYAILRQSRERRCEVLAAFDRHNDPYRHYMQSLLCYDLAPSHGAVVLIDSTLKIHKALRAFNQSAQPSVLIVHSDSAQPLGILTTTDFLRVVYIASTEDPLIGERTIKDFVQTHNCRKRLVSAPAHLSVWDASRLFCLNHVHRIPIVQVNEQFKETDILYMLSLRKIIYEAVFRLAEPTSSLVAHVKLRTVQEARVGTWGKIISIQEDAKCCELLKIFMQNKISCVPVMNERGSIIGSISKQDVMREIIKHTNNYLEILDICAKSICRPTKFATSTSTVYDAINLLLTSEQQCIFVTDTTTGMLSAAIAFIDIMEYLHTSADIRQKISSISCT